ncbi:MAG: hypothetical protein OQK48_04555 [Sulfurimonas sp.]|nr:hypothetical protein [Sulfurimonas sp.]
MKNNKVNKKYIFITFEGFTFQPYSESDVPDIENMQVIGFSEGKDKKEAFKNLLVNQQYLKDTTFNEIIALELADEKKDIFTIDDIRSSLTIG